MTLNPTLLVKTKINFEILNGTISLFKTGDIAISNGTDFTQDFGNTFTVPNATIDLQITMEGVTHANQIFFLADQPLQLKLVPQGSVPGTTPPHTLYPGLPSLLSVQDVIGVYITNQTGQAAQFMIHGVGTNS